MGVPKRPASGSEAGKGKTAEQAQTGDLSTQFSRERTGLSHERTHLSVERSYLASERTLMAWIRTSLSMITFGFTIGKLGQVLDDFEVKGLLGKTRTVSIEQLSYFLVILGTIALLGASVQHRFACTRSTKWGKFPVSSASRSL